MNSHVPNDFFESEAQEHMSIMQEIRRYIHSHPEAGADQPETVNYLASKFEDLPGVKTQFGDGHVGLVVDIKGGGDGPTIGLRADMDALYMDETDAPEHLPNKFGFRTTIDGLMHACGHDAHCAILTGAGLIIHNNRQHFKGTVRLLFQPGEEGFHGAQRMLEAGCLNDLDQVYAMHCIPTYKTGQLAYRKGGITSAIDMFKVKIKGIGGHGSAPEKASDQVLAASQIICNLQNIVSRRISPLENAVVSVCYVQGGNEISTTVMPAECEFAGSIRTYNLDIQKNIRQFFYEVCEHTAKSIHPSCVVDIEYKQIISRLLQSN